MTGERRKFRREGEERRRDALIAAALELISEGGPAAATVRAIADRAGVTPGLIRHYFQTKEDLTRAAYHAVMEKMTGANAQVLTDAPKAPEARLAVFVVASLRPPVMEPAAMALWAGFIVMVRRDMAMREEHEASYLAYRDLLQGLIAALPGTAGAHRHKPAPDRLRRLAIACNAVIDGLWLEGCALPHAFGEDEMAQIGLDAVGAILGLDLAAHLPKPADLPPTLLTAQTC